MTQRRTCACGGIIICPDDREQWAEHVLEHVRTARHHDWALRELSEQQPVKTLFGSLDGYERRRVA